MEFGIDLGTTQSCIAYVDETGSPVIIKSALGEDTTPSAVFFESRQNVVVGRAAREEALLTPDLVAQLVKREMGTDASYTFHGERHTPESVSALILKELARLAAAETGQEVRDVVITVPAYFGIAEREATRRAGALAGLTVLDVLDEPVAAAVHYQAVHGPAPEPKHALVYDLGGGTFDMTVIRLEGNDVRAICTKGDARLARTVEVIDRALAAARGQGVTDFDEVLLVGGMSRFPAVARLLTQRLGVSARLHEPELAVAKGAALFAQAKHAKHFENAAAEPPPGLAATAPTTASAEPAPEIRRLAAAKVSTVVPRAFGVKGVDSRDPLALSAPHRARQTIMHLLPADAQLPADTGPYPFATAVDNQRMLPIEVWEQASPEESPELADNHKVGEGMLRHLPPGLPAGTPFEITFFMSETGLLTVHAREPQSGRDVRFDLQIDGLDGTKFDAARRSVAGY